MKIAIIVAAGLALVAGAIKYLERQRQKEIYAKAMKVLDREV